MQAEMTWYSEIIFGYFCQNKSQYFSTNLNEKRRNFSFQTKNIRGSRSSKHSYALNMVEVFLSILDKLPGIPIYIENTEC